MFDFKTNKKMLFMLKTNWNIAVDNVNLMQKKRIDLLICWSFDINENIVPNTNEYSLNEYF